MYIQGSMICEMAGNKLALPYLLTLDVVSTSFTQKNNQTNSMSIWELSYWLWHLERAT